MTAPSFLTIRHAHLFCGLGGGARGFNRGRARVGNVQARFECMGGIAGVMGEVLILTALGETFSMSAQPIWVRPVTAALMAATGGLQ